MGLFKGKKWPVSIGSEIKRLDAEEATQKKREENKKPFPIRTVGKKATRHYSLEEQNEAGSRHRISSGSDFDQGESDEYSEKSNLTPEQARNLLGNDGRSPK